MASASEGTGNERGVVALLGPCAPDRANALRAATAELGVRVGMGFELNQSPYLPLEMVFQKRFAGTVEAVSDEIEQRDPAVIAISDAHLATDATLAVLAALAAARRVIVTVDTLQPSWQRVDDWLTESCAVCLPVDCADAAEHGDLVHEEDRVGLEAAFGMLDDDQQAFIGAIAVTGGRLDVSALPATVRDLQRRRILVSVGDTVAIQPHMLEQIAHEAMQPKIAEQSAELIVNAGRNAEDIVAAFVLLGRDTEALDLIMSTLASADAAERASMLLSAARLDRTMVSLAVDALVDVGRFDDAATLSPSADVLLRLEMSAGQHDRALELARELDDDVAIASLGVWPGWDESVAEGAASGSPLRALIRMEPDWDGLAKEELERPLSPLDRRNAALVLAVGYVLAGRGVEALGSIQEALSVHEATSELRSSAVAAGEIAAFYVSADLAVGSLSSREAIIGTRGLVEAFRACAAADQGRTGDALRYLDATPLPTFGIGRSLLLWARAEVELHAGRPHRVAAWPAAMVEANDPAIGLARVAHAWALFEEGLRIPEPPPASYDGLVAIVEEVNALRAASERSFDAAATLLGNAARSWAPAHTRGELRCLWGQGEFLRRAGELDSAKALLSSVEQSASALSFLPLVARSRQSLRRCGLDLRSGGRGAAGGLSIREEAAIRLVGEGRTSHEIAQELGIASSTVETQIRSAMLKLGVGTRLEAAAKLGGTDL